MSYWFHLFCRIVLSTEYMLSSETESTAAAQSHSYLVSSIMSNLSSNPPPQDGGEQRQELLAPLFCQKDNRVSLCINLQRVMHKSLIPFQKAGGCCIVANFFLHNSALCQLSTIRFQLGRWHNIVLLIKLILSCTMIVISIEAKYFVFFWYTILVMKLQSCKLILANPKVKIRYYKEENVATMKRKIKQ